MAKILQDTFDKGEINTLLAALNRFQTEMSEKNALGDDDAGESIRLGYFRICDKLLTALIKAEK
ncbi:TPA: hypothetical protein ACH1PF_002511 [Enterobacter cloacae]